VTGFRARNQGTLYLSGISRQFHQGQMKTITRSSKLMALFPGVASLSLAQAETRIT